MIIIRYLVRETLKSQIAILFILLLIFFSQKLVEVLGAAVEGNIPANLVLSLLGLGVPEMAQLILPLSLFLGVLMTFSKLYTESEITVMHACGLGKSVLVKSALILALLTAMLAAANVIWFTPWSSKYQEQVLADAKANPSLAAIMEGQFKPSNDGNMVLYIGNVKGNNFENVFLAQLRPTHNQRPSIVIADGGHMEALPNGNQVAVLHTGTRYEGTALLRDFRITDFNDYRAVIGHQNPDVDSGKVEQKSMTELWHSSNDKDARSELHWRLTLIASVLIMALMVVPLSAVNPRQGRVLSMLPAMLLYLIFFLLQSSLRSAGGKGKLDPMIWMWLVNGVYFALALALNVWDTTPMRKLRSRFKTQGAA
ncbi:LPS export ABC transporter permease LptF [Xenorhabdus sp. PB61.4]|uniref:Lipopolysaccharide export system permease protein LptF n=1 Tax=Xenorhabdus stockiae TaxID=351614 RepID=A0A2D0KLL7_9GAMM|nr:MULTISPECIES: LPS export ABC transporter permease LptF [Xenorhabdus]MCC8367272.1 LPS export ABC transporter permease LptF [Xenorhabdus sp. PB61.4]PHM64331.1 LPS export ABC transporter permease LptF [Xenorhabdus stockiae]PHM71801.1 LPS export ABC transporter permease LptF [Xenorhabdus sp. KJ12.1]